MKKLQFILWLKRLCFGVFFFYWAAYFISVAVPSRYFSKKVLGFEALLVPIRYQMFKGPFDRIIDVEYSFYKDGELEKKIGLEKFKEKWIRKEFPFSNETFKTDLVFNARFLYTQAALMRDTKAKSNQLNLKNYLTRKNLENVNRYSHIIAEKEFPNKSIDSCRVEMKIWELDSTIKYSPKTLHSKTINIEIR